MNKRTQHITISALISALLSIAFFLGYKNFDVGMLNRVFTLLGGDFISGGYIQFASYFAFLWGMLEIRYGLKAVKYQRNGFAKGQLPTNSLYVMPPEEVSDLMIKMNQVEDSLKQSKSPKLFLVDIIKKVSVKFSNNKNISEALELVSNQVRINRENTESKQSTIRYLAWLIPSIGFIGTILGISGAMGMAGQLSGNDISPVTDILGVAFDTTLISLVLSVFLMYNYHQLEERENKMHSDMEEYVTEHLINRIVLQ